MSTGHRHRLLGVESRHARASQIGPGRGDRLVSTGVSRPGRDSGRPRIGIRKNRRSGSPERTILASTPARPRAMPAGRVPRGGVGAAGLTGEPVDGQLQWQRAGSEVESSLATAGPGGVPRPHRGSRRWRSERCSPRGALAAEQPDIADVKNGPMAPTGEHLIDLYLEYQAYVKAAATPTSSFRARS